MIAEKLRPKSRELKQHTIEFDQKETDAQFLSSQIETHLKERFNVLLSTAVYEISEGHLVRQGKSEPFIDSIKRGRDYIHSTDPNPVDIDRENAEVYGFGETIDPFFSNPETPVGSKMISISPKGEEGSRYEHNFYDIFALIEKDGKKLVKMSRYSSGLTKDEYINYFETYKDANSSADFLSHPIFAGDISISTEEIHHKLHKKHTYMKTSDFEDVIWSSPLVQAMVRRYLSKRDGRSFNAILNAADEVWEGRNKNMAAYLFLNNISYKKIRSLEEKEVRQAGGGCPGRSGADIDGAPFSVSVFGSGEGGFDYKFDQDGPCKKCNADVKCGPCGICKACDLSIRASQKLSLN